uniref:Solute carrier family 24 member 2 n=1 Tax=Callorhinchus milii TaxID=7868 RepID=A0A4W3IGJ9_CALMI
MESSDVLGVGCNPDGKPELRTSRTKLFRKHQQQSKRKLRLTRVLGLCLGLMALSAFSLSSSAFSWSSAEPPQPRAEGEPGTATPSPAPTHEPKGEYPKDVFSLEERRRGAVVLHVFGMIYMFIALALVCDEFFVPSLTVIIEKLRISDDVAGATFMAAGGSAPELFTSLIGVFISHSNVGIGTIVGSAVFNILFVIGMCAVFSREILCLTWWPLFRDVSFYILDLILLIIFFLDNVIVWWESLILLSCYFSYVTFMKFNVGMESWVKGKLNRNKVVEATATDGEEKVTCPKPRLQRGGSSASLHNSLMRNSIFQLMINTLDPLAEGKFRERASILHKMAKKKCQLVDCEKPNGTADVHPPCDEDRPLSLAWPDTNRKRLAYLFVLPLIVPMWLTLPDVRKPKLQKFFPVTFFGSISWIAVFSYLMVWLAHQVGETIGITEEIMGLTILAAGTSIPDLITSVIVARKGLGDMAVSSSVGSNIFDITVGLPLPWLLFSLTHNFTKIQVSSNGLFCAIVLLFIMLLFVILSIGACRWKMNKILGLIMFVLYIVFLITSVLLEQKIIECPVSI